MMVKHTSRAQLSRRCRQGSRRRQAVFILVALSLLVPLGLSRLALADDPAGGSFRVRTLTMADGQAIDEVMIVGPPEPPRGFIRSLDTIPQPDAAAGVNVLSGVPAFNWSFGCSATSGAMIAGYYDRSGYCNMYTGPTNGGIMPLDNSSWPDVWISDQRRHQCPLSATRNGLDGRTTRGHVDDYWISYGKPGPDPFVLNGWSEHAPSECTADFMKTNKWFGAENGFNVDAGTTFYFFTDGDPLTADYIWFYGIDGYDGGYGLKLFYESRGYTVSSMYNQYIMGYDGNTAGFTFQQYMAEIDAGRPVMLHVEDHTLLGVGYDDASQKVYLHDTWDYEMHSMTWGGSYEGMEHYGVTIVQLAADGVEPTSTWVDLQGSGSTLGSQPLEAGTYLAVFDPQGTQCGETVVTQPGAYQVRCYGDDPSSPLDEGADPGDVLRFLVNGLEATTEAIALNAAPVAPHTVVTWLEHSDLWEVNLHGPGITVTSPNGGESWEAGSIQDITWDTTGLVGNVRIAVSVNGGFSWTDIVASTANDGAHSWTIASPPSDECLVRISESDGDPSDVSDAFFSIVPPPSITVTSPNGGESWETDSAHTITWDSIGIVGNVRIELSVNGGSSWAEIIGSTANDGAHPWAVPNMPSDDCLVRISETDGDPSDASDGPFTIAPPPSITVTSPNGSETWVAGYGKMITWTSSGAVSDVRIEFSADGGSSWTEVIAATPNDGTFDWVVQDTPSDSCLVRINEIDGDPSDASDGPFTIESPPSITVTSPNGGESWPAGSVQDITWTSKGEISVVIIEYSSNGGASWRAITRPTANDGQHPWEVPGQPSDNCLVRVAGVNDDGGPTDVSDAPFSIPQPGTIRVIAPRGGERWNVGSVQEITWTTSGSIDGVMIEYSIGWGAAWRLITPSTANDGSFDWTVPDTPSDDCLVRITSLSSDGDPRPSGVSDSAFSILGPPPSVIAVISPNGGESWPVGSVQTIGWRSWGTREDVKIEVSVNGGSGWSTIIATTPNDGRFEWSVPDTPSEECLVRISETDGDPSDESDDVFSIVALAPGEVTLTSPNGGEKWNAGSVQDITWTSDVTIDNVMLEYSTAQGASWLLITSSTPNDGQHDWVVPDLPSDDCLVRITSLSGDQDPRPSDVSDQVFSIVRPAPPTLAITSPNGGEVWLVGSVQTIGWLTWGTWEDVKIELSLNGGSDWSTIIATTPNDGAFGWTVPDTPSDGCLVRISETDGIPMDVSDSLFSIVPPLAGEVTLTSPNGGESWNSGSVQAITWTDGGGLNNVMLEYRTGQSMPWRLITSSTPNDGSFAWTVPDSPSDECLVRISGLDQDNDPRPSDVSDQVFSIVLPRTITVLSPNGGESWPAGSLQQVTWTGTGNIHSVRIEVSTDRGTSWSLITPGTGNGGSYDWTVPDTPSDTCRIRITALPEETEDSALVDASDGPFAIVPAGTARIMVLTPNGGEGLREGFAYDITWSSKGQVSDVTIAYSTNGGDTWIEIVAVTSNDGYFAWTVPDTISSNCLMRVSEKDGDPTDESDRPFAIVAAPPGSVQVITPNGGEDLAVGSTFDISWSSSGPTNVFISYSTDAGITWRFVAQAPASAGLYNWTVPPPASNACLVRIAGGETDASPADVSDTTFTITLERDLASVR